MYYKIDEQEDARVLRAAEYGGDAVFSWVLLEPVPPEEAVAGE